MARSKTCLVNLKVEDLYLNPSNDRFIEAVEDEKTAIIAMYDVPNGNPEKEMYNLAEDIAENGLNPFEFPIVWYDERIEKYIVIEGNRRITCIKLMTQYKNDDELVKNKNSIKAYYKLEMYDDFDGSVQCVEYEDLDEAKKVLAKIHQDINEGIGRKGWDSYAKENNKASLGIKTKAYSIIEFVKKYINDHEIDIDLLKQMQTEKWVSKLQRVISFSSFKETYNIDFSQNCTLMYKDTEDQVFIMLSKLIRDIIDKPATGNFRLKDDFKKYLSELDSQYKSLVKDNNEYIEGNSDDQCDLKSVQVKEENKEKEDTKVVQEPTHPRTNKRVNQNNDNALRLSRNYIEKEYDILGEKGRDILLELESLDYQRYPYSAAALSRSILEYIIKRWSEECDFKFVSDNLETCHKYCIGSLRTQGILDNKEHSSLSRNCNKEKYIDDLNSWIHGNDLLCVDLNRLKAGWKINRVLIEKFLRVKNK